MYKFSGVYRPYGKDDEDMTEEETREFVGRWAMPGHEVGEYSVSGGVVVITSNE